MTGKGMTLTGRGMDNKGTKVKMPQLVAQEVEQSSVYCGNSPAKKKKAHGNKSPSLNISDGFEAALTDANREVNMLFSKYSDVLRERAAVDTSQVRELEDILMEARSLESHLKEKKDHLRQSLAVISDKLQG